MNRDAPRYHTPVVTIQEGKGLTEDLIKLAGPLILQQAQAGLQDIQRGQSAADTWARRSAQLNRGLKRKASAMAWTIGKHKAKRPAQNTYKRATQRVRDIFGRSKSMVHIGGFLKTQNRIRRQRAHGRFISPYQVGARSLASPPWRAIP